MSTWWSSPRILGPFSYAGEETPIASLLVRPDGSIYIAVAEDEAEIIVCKDNFHGRTITIVGFSTDNSSRQGFGPFTPGFKIIPYGDARALEQAITPHTVGFLVEPIQGEAGVYVPEDGYLKKAYDLCKEKNVLFIADEVQTGMGRTGKWFGFQHYGVEPDAFSLAKALGSGYPIGNITKGRSPLVIPAKLPVSMAPRGRLRLYVKEWWK